jgi:hypothetical protein
MPDDILQQAKEILGRIEEAIGQVGYGQFCESITEDGGQYGPDSMVGSRGPINIIPGDKAGCCCDLVLAVSKGGLTSRFGFDIITRQIRAHLIDCIGQTRLVIFLTDSWNPSKLEESRGDFEAHRRRGTLVVPILVNGHQLVPMA